jgi:hypothetical protein
MSVGSLSDYTMGFTIYSAGWGGGAADVVLRLSESDLTALDAHEGRPDHYDRFCASIETSDGPLDAWVYGVTHKSSFIAPSRAYLDILVREAERLQFPEDYIVALQSVRSA